MLFKSLSRFALTMVIMSLLGIGLIDYLQNFEDNECSMTYMMQNPSLIPVHLNSDIENKFPNYNLYLYCEGYDCQKYEKLKFETPGEIPVLFITGNSDSHKQVRSLASVGLEKSRQEKYSKRGIKFHYFTISFNEELSALYGPLLELQTEYSQHCVRHIMKLFSGVKPVSKRPKNVLVIGNSMGGIIARGLLASKDSGDDMISLVNTIITQATPHTRPVLSMDPLIADYYERVNRFWMNESEVRLDNVVIASSHGGPRDILVRSGLANINDWKGKSRAGVISAFTLSTPFVYRSIDHRCMSWCRELILTMNRAFFKMIDPSTGQIYQDRVNRETVIRYFLEKDAYESKPEPLNLPDGKTKLESSKYDNFEFNGFNKEKKVVLLDLEEASKKFDSLFVYTNLNSEGSFVLCKDEYNCDQDLMGIYGRSMPPLFEGISRQNSLRSAYINPLDSLVSLSFKYLAIRIPIWSYKINKHQLIIKVDFHLRRERVSEVLVPNLIDPVFKIDLSDSKNVVFNRVYLSNFKNVLQAFILKKLVTSWENNCDRLLKDTLMSSVLAIQFVEPVSKSQKGNEHIHHSNSVGTKSNNLTLRLISNHEENTPYIDFIRFNPSHLAKLGSIDQNSLDKCSNKFTIELKLSYWAILGQWVRFYAVLTPAFVVLVLQFYDFMILSVNLSKPNEPKFLILNQFQTCLLANLVFSLAFCALSWFASFVDFGFFQNDYQKLKNEKIFHPILSLSLYWVAFSLISVATGFLSILFSTLSFLINRFVLKIFIFLNNSALQKILMLLHFLIAISCGFISSALGQAALFYGELIRLCLGNPIYEANVSSETWMDFFSEQIRMLLIYLLLVLNLPSLIVWTKSLGNEFKPMFELKGDYHLTGFVLLGILHLANIIRRHLGFCLVKKEYLSILVFGNCVLTGLFSTLSLHRLSFFILSHLAIMSFRQTSIQCKKTKKE